MSNNIQCLIISYQMVWHIEFILINWLIFLSMKMKKKWLLIWIIFLWITSKSFIHEHIFFEFVAWWMKNWKTRWNMSFIDPLFEWLFVYKNHFPIANENFKWIKRDILYYCHSKRCEMPRRNCVFVCVCLFYFSFSIKRLQFSMK